jgi:peroxiredoxin Q/BCP
MHPLNVNDLAPTFIAQSTLGAIQSTDTLGHPFVLYFYPKDNTPGCTTETSDFRDLHEQFRQVGCYIAGVSRDNLKSHQGFSQKLGLPFALIADPDETICTLFGVMKMKNMYGKQVRGIERSTFVIDKNGNLVKEWRGVKVEGHAAEVLSFIQTL